MTVKKRTQVEKSWESSRILNVKYFVTFEKNKKQTIEEKDNLSV